MEGCAKIQGTEPDIKSDLSWGRLHITPAFFFHVWAALQGLYRSSTRNSSNDPDLNSTVFFLVPSPRVSQHLYSETYWQDTSCQGQKWSFQISRQLLGPVELVSVFFFLILSSRKTELMMTVVGGLSRAFRIEKHLSSDSEYCLHIWPREQHWSPVAEAL